MGEIINKKIKGKIIFKHETEEHWLLSDYVPEDGEMVLYDEDATHEYKRTKYGDGIRKVRDLPFAPESEWDYVITQLDNFTTDSLAKMSGRVLVKNVEGSINRVHVTLHKDITTLEFIDCNLTYD